MDTMKKLKSSSQLKSSSSVQVVLNQDQDLLTLILLRLPWKNLMSLKSVSRQWNSLITSPQFTHLRSLLPLRASGLFMEHSDQVYFVPLDNPDTPSSLFRTLTFLHDSNLRISRSCNGLLLCYNRTYVEFSWQDYYVYNPSTNQLDILPEHPPADLVYCTGLAFDPSKSLHYKVIVFVYTSSAARLGDFYVYSSETRTWKVSVQSFRLARGMGFHGGVYWHDCIHWLGNDWLGNDVAECLYFDVDKGRLGTFPGPPNVMTSPWRRSKYFGASEDHLHLIQVCRYAASLSVYELKSDYSEWFVKYRIDLAPISEVFPEMINNQALEGEYSYAVGVLSLIRREKFQEDSFLVLEVPGKAIRYNLVDRTVKVIWDLPQDSEKLDHWPFGWRNLVWQYFETLSCV